MQTQTPIFDMARPVELRIRSAALTKTVRVRFPTDAEWTDRQRRRKVVIKQLGRGMSETSAPGGEKADEDLLRKIRMGDDGDGLVELDAFEASKIVDELGSVDVDEVEPAPEGFRVALRVPGGMTAVVAGIPAAKDVFDYRRGFARIVDLPFGKQELTVNLLAAAALFEKIVRSAEGYAGGKVPIIHQTVVVKAVLEAIDAGLASEEKPEDF